MHRVSKLKKNKLQAWIILVHFWWT